MYPILVTFSLILVFGSSAFMAISGLVSFFPSNLLIIICMGIGIEVGKILSISHLYRSWKINSVLVKSGYIFIIFVLTTLTAFEIMGFLSQSHQKSIRVNQDIQIKIETLENEEQILKAQIDVIDNTLNGLPESHVTRRINERKKSKYETKQKRLLDIIRFKSGLKSQLISLDDNSNLLSSIALIIKVKESTIISIFIPFLVMILEPLSIGLTIAANAAWLDYKESPRPESNKKSKEIESLTEELKNLQKEHNLSVAQIARITDRKKIKTCENWLKGKIPTPPRAVADIKIWLDKQKQNVSVQDKPIGLVKLKRGADDQTIQQG